MIPDELGVGTIQDISTALQTPPNAIFTAPRERLGKTRDYLPSLTGLRFGLAFWVILHHITGKGMMLEGWANGLPKAGLEFVRGGYLAVQTFFILSGFVLARTYARAEWTPNSLKRFATARLARIYPVYLVSLLVVSPFMIEMLTQPGWTGAQRGRLLTNYLLVLQGWTGSLKVGWNTPAWTLSCEFFFYLCFPILIAVLRRARWMTIGLAMTTAVAMPIMFDHMGVPWDWKPIYHTADFVAGIAAARAFTLLESHGGWWDRGYWLSIPALISGGWLIIHPHVVDGRGADLNTYLRPLNVLLLIGLALGGGVLARLLSTKPADFLGKASYSMYVLHVPMLWWYPRYFLHGKWHFSQPMAAVLYLALVMVVSGMMYQWFEAPASTWIRDWQKKRKKVLEFAGVSTIRVSF